MSFSRTKSHVSSHIPIRHHRTKPTPPDEELRDFRSNPTSPDQSDCLLPPHNPSVVGSIPTGPTKWPEPIGSKTSPKADNRFAYIRTASFLDLFPMTRRYLTGVRRRRRNSLRSKRDVSFGQRAKSQLRCEGGAGLWFWVWSTR